ncbi:MAG: AraC family transcriptional regulator [Hyphomicrobiales bacterium]
MIEATVSAGYVKAMIDFVLTQGITLDQLLIHSAFNPSDFGDLDKRLLMSDYIKLVRNAKILTRDDALILHFCENTNIEKFTIVGLICGSVSTMGEALKQLNRFSQLVVETDLFMDNKRFELTQDGDGLWLEDMRTNPNQFYELTEATFGRFVCEFNRYFIGKPFLKALHVTHPKTSYSGEYDRLFNVPIQYNSPRNAILIDPTWLSIEISNSANYVFGILSRHAEDLLHQLKSSTSIKDKVESLILPQLHTGVVNMEWAANEMSTTRQTLYRKLKAENTNFESLFDELRHKIAMHYLNGNKASVNEIAYLVGFSDPSGFSKAFKRWTGISPNKFKPKE